jgi:hypothetical protein
VRRQPPTATTGLSATWDKTTDLITAVNALVGCHVDTDFDHVILHDDRPVVPTVARAAATLTAWGVQKSPADKKLARLESDLRRTRLQLAAPTRVRV